MVIGIIFFVIDNWFFDGKMEMTTLIVDILLWPVGVSIYIYELVTGKRV
jgi:hypothetical protein